MIKTFLAMVCGLLFWTAGLSAAQGFEDEDRVVFFGDSITHGGTYHLYLRDYYYTRYPGASFHFVNRGLSGDSAGGALARIALDVAPHRPNRVLVHFGMNDIGRNHYGRKPITPGLEKARRAALVKYAENLENVVKRLTDSEIRVTILSPTPYDETMVRDGENLVGCVDALAECAEIGRRVARRYQCDTIDVLTPMLRINGEVQKRDPSDTIISADRVHPREVGHPILAGLILEGQQQPAEVAACTIDAASGKATETRNCEISDAVCSADGAAFVYLPRALPFPLFPEREKVDRIYGFTGKFNREPLKVTGLKAGEYLLAMDGLPVGRFSAADFAAGVNLAVLPDSPLQKQSQKIRSLVRAVGALEARLCVLSQVRALYAAHKVKPNDAAAADALWERLFKQYADNDKYWRGLRKTYEEVLPKQREIDKERDALLAEIETLRKIEPVKIEIKKP